MILLIDNYDSFVHNLARYFRRLGQETRVVRNDQISAREVEQIRPEAIVLSPGPCAPPQAGCCLSVVQELHATVPILGVCLGHQVIATAFGGEIIRAREPVHGRASAIHHDGSGVFVGLPPSVLVARYHSLVACPKTLPGCLRVNASLEDGTIMAIEHREFPVVGLQFHPESVLTQHGYQVLQSFLAIANVATELDASSYAVEHRSADPNQPDWFQRAIEFPGN
jgi:anthranilate synthase/aminodeoxychorismate synthase-like glutamine amidotransferase